MFDVNWEARSHADIHAQLQGRGGGFTDAGGAWNQLATRLRDVAGTVERATGGIAATRTGVAAQAAQGSVGPMGAWAAEARTFSDSVGAVSYEQNRALASTRAAVGPPVPRPPVPLSTWEGVGALAALDVDTAERASSDAANRARAAMGRYQEFSSLRASELPRFAAPTQGPPQVGVAVPSGAGGVGGRGAGGVPGTTTPGAGGASAGTGGPGGPAGPGGAAVPGGAAGPGGPAGRGGAAVPGGAAGPGSAGAPGGTAIPGGAARPGGSAGSGGAAVPGRPTAPGPAGTAGGGVVPGATPGAVPPRSGAPGSGGALPSGTGPGSAGPTRTAPGAIGPGASTGAGAARPTLPGAVPSTGGGVLGTGAGSGFGPPGSGTTTGSAVTGSAGSGNTGTTSPGPTSASGVRPSLEPGLRPGGSGSVLEPALGGRAAASAAERGAMPFAPLGGMSTSASDGQRLPRAAYLVEDDPDAITGGLPRVVPPVIGDVR
ncbi:hypothetical protein [Actinomycetospora atypica]|uniref:PPE family domain-containing protein n=1 Tax=Actinomycetospora atypica TaxID=1290095 RepID=A0ABV9YU30_9PSEU